MTQPAVAYPAPAPFGRPLGRRAVRRSGLRPLHLLLVAVAASALGNLGRLPFALLLGRETPLLVHEIVLVLGLAAAAIACAQARALRIDGVAVVALAFATIGAGSAVASAAQYGLSAGELAFSLAYLARWLLYIGLYVSVLNTAGDGDADRIWSAVERTVLAIALFGIVQSLLLPGFAQRVFPVDADTLGWDVQGRRLVSTLLDPNFAGAVLLLPLLVHVGLLAYGVRVAAWKPIVLVAGIALTASRSTALALVAGVAVIFAARGATRRVLRLGAAVAGLALLTSPLLVGFLAEYSKFSIDGSARLRVVSWLRALTVLADHPAFGVGFNTYGYVQRAYGWDVLGREGFGLDGGLLFVAVMTGLVGAGLYVLMLALVVRRCRRVWRSAAVPRAARGLALGTGAGVVAVCVHSVFVNSLTLPFVMAPQVALWGAVLLHARGRARGAA